MRKIEKILIFLLIIYGFLLRINGLWLNYSLWTDEASTARFARGILETGLPRISFTGYAENSYYVTHYLTALSFALFGQNEMAGRLPEVFFGTALIFTVYLVGKKWFNSWIGIGASALAAFSYIQIAWSRQARGYVILEVFFLLSIFFLSELVQKTNFKNVFLLILLSLLSIWTHTLGLILLPVIIIYLLIFSDFKILLKKRSFFLIFLGFFCLLLFLSNLREVINVALRETYHLINLNKKPFLAYYHSLFWRQYPLISFLSFWGLFLLWIRKKFQIFWLLIITFFFFLFSISFIVGVPFEKYALVLFPLFYLLTNFFLYEVVKIFSLKEKRKIFFLLLMVFLIIVNGNKFSFVPRLFYSLNFDMREIPEIDYKEIYSFLKKKTNNNFQEIAIVDISHDIPAWYLGEGRNLFIPRKDVPNELNINKNSGAFFIHNLEEFEEVMANYPAGFLVLVEHNFRFYPEGLVDYARKNLKLEGKENFAWFSYDWNFWPVEFYSWGME